jgi:hypothetical protein
MREMAGPVLGRILPDDWSALDPLARAMLVASVLDAGAPTFAACVEEALETYELAFDDLELP